MKKLFVCAALASMVFAGCQNEELIDDSIMQGGEEFTLVIERGAESRTELAGDATYWSVGDEIYVTSADGQVKGVLKYQGTEPGANGQFKGFVFGGKASNLSHVIFPVPEKGIVPLNQPEGEKLDLPMFGELSMNGGTATATLENMCAMVDMPVIGAEKIELSGENLTGHYVFENGTLKFINDPEGKFGIDVGNNGKVRFASAAVTETNGDTETAVTKVDVIVNGNTNAPVSVPVQAGQISSNGVPNVEVGKDGKVESYILAKNENELHTAVSAGKDVKLGGDIKLTDPVIVGKTVTIDLDDHTLTGGVFAENDGKISEGTTDSYVFWVREGGHLTIEGNGSVIASEAKYSIAVWAKDGGIVDIKGGKFSNGGDGTDCIYASNGGIINIYQGEFSAATNTGAEPGTKNPYSVLNLKDAGNGIEESFIHVYGGKFYCFNPAANVSENPKENFVAEGYKVIDAETREEIGDEYANGDDEIWFEVVPVE